MNRLRKQTKMYQKGWYLMRGGQKKLTYERCKCSLGIRWVNSREKEQTVNKDKRARTQQSNNWVQEPLSNTMKLGSRILPVKGSEFLDQPPNFHLQPIWSLRFMKWIL